MSTWRKKAIACAPELRQEFEVPGLTPYDVFMELLPKAMKAHEEQDKETLQKIYAYAEWCLHQNEKALWNAAGTAFYEHICDSNEGFRDFTKWISKPVYAEIRGLIEARLDPKKLKTLQDFYGNNPSKLTR